MQNRVSKYYIVGMYIGINFVTKKVISILFALALFSCRPVVNQPTSKSSASDSVELKKQEAWESAHRLDSMWNHREALLLRERTLSEYCPNSAECLQYKGLRYNQALQQLKESTEGIRNVVVVINSLK